MKIQFKILLLLGCVVFFSLGFTLFIVREDVSFQIRTDLKSSLVTRYDLIESLLNSEENSLIKQSILLAEEPMIKACMSDGDLPTIRDTAKEVHNMVGGDLIILLGKNGENLCQLPLQKKPFLTQNREEVQAQLKKPEAFSGCVFWESEGVLYLISLTPVIVRGELLGLLAVGKSLDEKFCHFLENKSRTRVSLWSQGKLFAQSWQGMRAIQGEYIPMEGSLFLGKSFPFKREKKILEFFLQDNYSLALETLNSTTKRLVLVGINIFLIAFAISYLFSEQLTKPIRTLLSGVQRVSEGDFDHQVRTDSSDELGSLSESFEMMRLSLIEQREELKKSAALKKDLEFAGKIQSGLLPRSIPKIKGLQVFSKLLPATQIGGDYFGYFTGTGESLGGVIADVAGHGAGSALLMSMARTVLLSQTQFHPHPDKLLDITNQVLYPDLEEAETHITMFCFHFDPIQKRLKYTNAGHNFPLLFRFQTDEFVELDSDGMMIGVLEEGGYQLKTTQLEPGDFLVLYTDGFNETLNENGEEFGVDRMKSLFLSLKGSPPEAMVSALFQEVEIFSGVAGQNDDRTLMIMKYVS